ncbi:LysR family transcriptional regulator [Novacetimonas maltaceti]|uniref:Transcriptional regulator LysR n=2 Tax=Komagataeibacter TaxID=1434011 RepID=A0A0D6PZ54_KOMEU|nr:LysR family transcriptional regulator [Novacetimonas maltaceti]BAK84728.1 transcriptional regulator LysR family [Komagataeibacter medellinensis NBRC 3288]GAN96464.1 transcriptional regulator LysR [Komagataeibacter europaeus NBRC 3261]
MEHGSVKQDYDLNLLYVLALLLEEQSVIGVARRMKVSSATISRFLARIREAFSDPILVLSGRRMVLTPRAMELQAQVATVLASARALSRQEEVDFTKLTPSFTIRANDVVTSVFSGPLMQELTRTCPGCHLRFAPESEGHDSEALRKGTVDLFIGATRELQQDIRRQKLFSTKFRGVVRNGHPILDGEITPEAFTRYNHVVVSRKGRRRGPIDVALDQGYGLERNIALVMPSHYAALHGITHTDLIFSMPDIVESGLSIAAVGLIAFEIPVMVEPLEVFQAWHPRLDTDPVHRWLRTAITNVVRRRLER